MVQTDVFLNVVESISGVKKLPSSAGPKCSIPVVGVKVQVSMHGST